MTTPVSSMLLIVLSSFIGSFGAVLLKSGAGRLHRNITSLLFNYHLAAGITLYLLSSYFFVLGVRQGELTILYPLVALSYVFTMVWSRLFFGEPFTKAKFLGLAMIVSGIALLVAGSR
jgi:drug/metabolite transporter (DMT)-like permease